MPLLLAALKYRPLMIGVSKQVGRELVVIPYESVLNVVLDTVKRDFCKIFIHHKLVKALYAHIDGKSFQRSFPWMFFLTDGSFSA